MAFSGSLEEKKKVEKAASTNFSSLRRFYQQLLFIMLAIFVQSLFMYAMATL